MEDVLNPEDGPREPAARKELMHALGRVMSLPEGQALATHVLRSLGVGRIISVSETDVMARNLGLDGLRYILEACPGAGMNILAELFCKWG